ncbi:hypothetical protein [Roseateles amylovorans]|uniref:Uncharacterized protein n=1 Tax=Roseateles amylovorans TaxID=2978473 RepID=A0ABY6B6W0_9BURK|nr:hypothetical protein [Roseateles amylovorans]UXH80674.1 hypothetical protein N4261_12675 [Roseateles amylovorans]
MKPFADTSAATLRTKTPQPAAALIASEKTLAPSPSNPLQAAIDASPRMLAQRRAIDAAFGAAADPAVVQRTRPSQQQAAAQPQSHSRNTGSPSASVAQRVIVRGQGKGAYMDDDSGHEFAFLKQSPNGKNLLFANRDQLSNIRDLILAGSQLPVVASNQRSVRDAMDTWRKQRRDTAADAAVTDALSKLKLVWVEEDKETNCTYDECAGDVQSVLVTVLGHTNEKWGRLTFKKPGFGERAPVASGTVTMNNQHGVDKNSVRESLDISKKDLSGKGRFKGVEFRELTDPHYSLASTTAGDNAVTVEGKDGQYFYVSKATRTARTTSATEGNYVLNGRSFANLAAIPANDAAINQSYAKLVTDRSVQDWAKVDRVGMRAGTQDQAMDKWNALGMAAYAKKVLGFNLALNQDYEWLHIRGVQNGGRNLISNLGTGTWIANSAMIPFENQIRHWADTKPGQLFARYETTTHGVNTPVLNQITIKVAASDDHAIGPISRDDPLTVVFNAQSGLLQDTFSNKIRIKDYHQRAGGLAYQEGVKAAAAGGPALDSARHARGHRHYQEGVAAARRGDPAPATRGGAAGHADYWAGVATARASGSAGVGGHAVGFNHYVAGMQAARANGTAGVGGQAVGHADYLAGVLAASVGAAAGTGAHGVGHADWHRGYAQGRVGNLVNFVHSGEVRGCQAGIRNFLDKQSKTRKLDDEDDDVFEDDDDDQSDDEGPKRIKLDASIATSFRNGSAPQSGTSTPSQ